jgi:hypothetical protein
MSAEELRHKLDELLAAQPRSTAEMMERVGDEKYFSTALEM